MNAVYRKKRNTGEYY